MAAATTSSMIVGQQPAAPTPKMSKEQRDRMVDLMSQNFHIVHGCPTPNNNIMRKIKWEQITEELNTLGPMKDVERWKKCWQDMRRRIRIKAKKIRHQKSNIENGASSEITLMDFEERVLELFGAESLDEHDSGDNTEKVAIKQEIVEEQQNVNNDFKVILKEEDKSVSIGHESPISNALSTPLVLGPSSKPKTTSLKPSTKKTKLKRSEKKRRQQQALIEAEHLAYAEEFLSLQRRTVEILENIQRYVGDIHHRLLST